VGIGTSSPTVKLQISEGNLRLERTSSIPSANIYSVQASGYAPAFLTLNRLGAGQTATPSGAGLGEIRFDGLDTNGTYMNTATITGLAGTNAAGGAPGFLTFSTAPSGSSAIERMRLDSSGNLLVGRTTSNGRVSIQGGGNTSATNSLSIINSAGSACLQVRDDRQIFADGISSGAGTYALKWQASGQFTYDTSSARYKDNIRDSAYGLSAVMQMRSAMFEYKDSGRTDVGLIAEELDLIVPELVANNAEGQPDAVAYDRVTSVLIKAIQELKAEFDAYKATHP
jgi:hypothetical protein